MGEGGIKVAGRWSDAGLGGCDLGKSGCDLVQPLMNPVYRSVSVAFYEHPELRPLSNKEAMVRRGAKALTAITL
jgi:hypothetical protein